MARPVTLFTGQWADLTFDQICAKAKSFGYDGVELACWGDHFDVDQGAERRQLLQGPLGRAQVARAEDVRDLESFGRPGGLRPHRRAPQAHPRERCLG